MTLKNLQNPDWCAEICDITFFLPSPAHFSWVNEQRQNTKMGKIFLVKCPNCSNSIRLCVGGGPHRSSWKSTWEFVFSVAWVILCIIILMILTWNYILNFGQNKERSLSGPTELAVGFSGCSTGRIRPRAHEEWMGDDRQELTHPLWLTQCGVPSFFSYIRPIMHIHVDSVGAPRGSVDCTPCTHSKMCIRGLWG